MNNSIRQHLILLGENDFETKYRSIPDFVDNRDEMLAEIHENMKDGGLPPNYLRYFEVNGFSDSKNLDQYLTKSFDQFRMEFHAGMYGNNKDLIAELESQINVIKKNIDQAIYEANQIKDDELKNLLNIKMAFCDESIAFINKQEHYPNTIDANSIQEQIKKPKVEKERHSFKWLKSNEKLESLFSKMKTNKLIAVNSQPNDFKTIFSNQPISSISRPIHWEMKANLFAYFFKELMDKKCIPRSPSWVLLEHCFTYYREDIGDVVPVHVGVKSHVTEFKDYNPKYFELVDELFVSDENHK